MVIVAAVAFGALVLLGLHMTGAVAWRVVTRKPLVPLEPHRPVPWNGFHVLLAMMIYFLLAQAALVIVGGPMAQEPAVAGGWISRPRQGPASVEFSALDRPAGWRVTATMCAPRAGDSPQWPRNGAPPLLAQLAGVIGRPPQPEPAIDVGRQIRLLLAGAIAGLLSVCVAAMMLRLVARATWSDLGLSWSRVVRDVMLGVVGFLAVMVPIYGLHAVVTLLFEPQRQHALIELLLDAPNPLLLVLATISAVVVAPITEEFFFRGVLQGWLEAKALARLAHLQAAKAEDAARGNTRLGPPGAGGEAAASSGAPPRGDTLLPGPILITSAVFSFLHVQHGMSFVPLFFLSLALGYLYQRTHRLLPSITVHACLNGLSMAFLWLFLSGG